MQLLPALLRYILIVAVQLIAFFFFYNHPHGRHAVYRTWYAWIIDLGAIASGTLIMGLSVYVLHHPEVFASPVPPIFFWLSFIVGGWQASIHAVKWIIRILDKKKPLGG